MQRSLLVKKLAPDDADKPKGPHREQLTRVSPVPLQVDFSKCPLGGSVTPLISWFTEIPRCLSFVRKFLPYFALHLSKQKLHPREVQFYQEVKVKKIKKERLVLNHLAQCQQGSSCGLLFSFSLLSLPDLIHDNTWCWTKVKGEEAGQVSFALSPCPCPMYILICEYTQRAAEQACGWSIPWMSIGLHPEQKGSVDGSEPVRFCPSCSHEPLSPFHVWGAGWVSHFLDLSDLRRGCSKTRPQTAAIHLCFFFEAFSEPGLTFSWISWKLAPRITEFVKTMGLEWPLCLSQGGSGCAVCWDLSVSADLSSTEGCSLLRDYFICLCVGGCLWKFQFYLSLIYVHNYTSKQ